MCTLSLILFVFLVKLLFPGKENELDQSWSPLPRKCSSSVVARLAGAPASSAFCAVRRRATTSETITVTIWKVTSGLTWTPGSSITAVTADALWREGDSRLWPPPPSSFLPPDDNTSQWSSALWRYYYACDSSQCQCRWWIVLGCLIHFY